MATIRSYSELMGLDSLMERYAYLVLGGRVGEMTFGFDRALNQMFYKSQEWSNVRRKVILRDNGCDLGIPNYEIHKGITIHHLNPMTVADLQDGNPDILNPEYLITTVHSTHNAIHYGDVRLLPRVIVERRPGDTKLW